MSKRPNYVFDDELYHWGILGQKWGTRRYQNEDGSLTPEGREHYGYGDEKSKARITYNTQKYKADLKSKAKQDKITRTAKEERHTIKENAKTSRLARKEQGKFERLNKKENARLDNQNRPKFGNTKNMSDDELRSAIDRLKLQAEYNKQYVLATNNNPMLVKADRFFEGATGRMVRDIAVATIPSVVTQTTKSLLDTNLKYANALDREAQEAYIKKMNTETATNLAKAQADIADKEASTKKTYSDMDLNVRKANVDMANTRSSISKNYAEIAERRSNMDINSRKAAAEIAERNSNMNINARKANVDMANTRSNISKNYAEIYKKRTEAENARKETEDKIKEAEHRRQLANKMPPEDILKYLNSNQGNQGKKKKGR